MGAFPIGLLPVGVRARSPIFLFAACNGGAAKLSSSVELCDSVDLRFFDRVGAIVIYLCQTPESYSDSKCWLRHSRSSKRSVDWSLVNYTRYDGSGLEDLM